MRFENMAVRTRILVMVLLPLAAFLAVGTKIVWQNFQKRSLAQRIHDNAICLQAAGDLLNQLQTERGKTSLYLAGKGTVSEMERQRQETDASMEAYKQALMSAAIAPDAKSKYALDGFGLLENLRGKVGTAYTQPEQSSLAYTEVVEQLLSLLNVLADAPSAQAVSDGMNTIQVLESAKENAGLLRTTLSGVVARDSSIPEDVLHKLVKCEGGWQANIASRSLMLSESNQARLDGFSHKHPWQDLDRAAKLVIYKGHEGRYGLDAQALWSSATEVVDDLAALIKSENDELKAYAEQEESNDTSALIWEALILAVVFVATLILSLFMANGIAKSVHAAADLLKTMADGDFSGKIAPRELERGDEFGVLARACGSLLESIRSMVGSMIENSETLAASASELSSVSAQSTHIVQTLAERTSTVAAAAEESSANTSSVASSMERASVNLTSVAGATEEMSSTIGEIASNSEKARSISADAGAMAVSVTALMQQLGEAAREIGKVTETITNISSQTNLLALNATIEAARAGAAGKGFAVVANEIKELAKQTAAATVDIKSKIGDVQASANSAIADAEKITGVISEVGELVSGIATAIEEQAVVTRDLAGNIAQASSGVQDANERVSQTAEVSKTIAQDIAGVDAASTEIRSGGERVQSSAAELLMLSEQLKDLVAQFKIGVLDKKSDKPMGAKGARTVLIEWSDRLSVGSNAMDADHKKLVKLINELYSAIRQNQGTDVLQKLLDGLKEYVQYHFKAEEELMAKVAYPGLQAQQTAHQKFLIAVVAMEKRWQAGDKTVISEMMNVLQTWLVDHIMKMDKKYATYVAGH